MAPATGSGRLWRRSPFIALSCIAACASAAAAACFTAPPPDLPAPPLERPTSLHASVVPPVDEILPELPADGTFLVPVQLTAGNESFQWDVFIDYDPFAGRAPTIFIAVTNPGTLDGGVYVVQFQLQATDLPAGYCHRIEFLVAHQFDPIGLHSFDSVGGDTVTWFYNAGGGPEGCPEYDAGALQDGAFPPPVADAGADVLPVIPTDARLDGPG